MNIQPEVITSLPWTVDDYHRMIAASILTEDEKVELIAGQILVMSPQRPPHAATTHIASTYLRQLTFSKADVRVQLPVTLYPDSEPEPDIAVVRIHPDNYFENHPTPDDIFLLVEVADRTLYKDRTVKARIYAEAKIADYWVLDVNARQVYIYREPTPEGYQQMMVLSEDARISLIAFPEIEVEVKRLFV